MSQISIEGIIYTPADFTGDQIDDFADKSTFGRQLYLFLKEWFSISPTLRLLTSGSTGKPKKSLYGKRTDACKALKAPAVSSVWEKETGSTMLAFRVYAGEDDGCP
jgi:hypothetical protein